VSKSASASSAPAQRRGRRYFFNGAFLLTVPHLGQLNKVTLSVSTDNLLQLTKHFGFSAPLLEKVTLTFASPENADVQHTFDGNLSLRKLRLSGSTTDRLGDLSNFNTFDHRLVPSDEVSVTESLNLFELAPLLRKNGWCLSPT